MRSNIFLTRDSHTFIETALFEQGHKENIHLKRDLDKTLIRRRCTVF